MINSIDAEKAFDKILHHFMIKSAQQTRNRKNYLNIIKAIYENSTSYSTVKNYKHFKIKNKTKMLALAMPIKYGVGSSK